MLGVPGVISPASATCRQGRALSKTSAASSGVLTGPTEPSQTARRDAASPTAKKGDRPRASRMTHLLAPISGPMPAGSPSDTANGGIPAGHGNVDNRIDEIGRQSGRERVGQYGY